MDIRRKMEKINNLLNGELTNDLKYSVIDYEFNNEIKSLWSDEVEKLYQEYTDLQDEIDRFIENNELDDVLDKETIINHFVNNNIIGNFYFEINQAVLVDFEQFVVYYLEYRDRKEDLIEKLVDFEAKYDIFDMEERTKENIENDLKTIKDIENYSNYYKKILMSENDNNNQEFTKNIQEFIVSLNELAKKFINL